jgi:hypothetical protein
MVMLGTDLLMTGVHTAIIAEGNTRDGGVLQEVGMLTIIEN